jgi:hypothetical protein
MEYSAIILFHDRRDGSITNWTAAMKRRHSKQNPLLPHVVVARQERVECCKRLPFSSETPRSLCAKRSNIRCVPFHEVSLSAEFDLRQRVRHERLSANFGREKKADGKTYTTLK